MYRGELLELMKRTRSTVLTTLQPGDQTLKVTDSATDDDVDWITHSVTPNIDTNVTDVLSAAKFSTEFVEYFYVNSSNTRAPGGPVTGNHSAMTSSTLPTLNGSDQSDPERFTATTRTIWSAGSGFANASSDADVTAIATNQTRNGSTGLDVMTSAEDRRIPTSAGHVGLSGENVTSTQSVLNNDVTERFTLPPWLFDDQSLLEDMMNKHRHEMDRPSGKKRYMYDKYTII